MKRQEGGTPAPYPDEPPPTRVPGVPPVDLAALIDSTLLSPAAAEDEVGKHCEEAASLGCAAAVVLPVYLDLCVRVLEGSPTKPCVPAAFPTGGVTREMLEAEVSDALARGAGEIDMVAPLGLFRSGRHGDVVEHVHAAASLVHDEGRILKVILETALLTDEEIRRAASLAADGGADFVKTCSGLYGGATAEHVRIMRAAVPPAVGVKASGGVSTYERALEMIEAGANRIGTSSTRAILEGAPDG